MAGLNLALNTDSESGLHRELSNLDGEVQNLRVGMAYATAAGLDIFRTTTDSFVPHSDQQWLVSIDQGITQPRALRSLLEHPQSEVRVAGGQEALRSGDLSTSSKFHPKMFWFDRDGVHDLLMGSANLTQRGLHSNWEAGMLVHGLKEENHPELFEQLSGWWGDAWARATPVTTDFIAEYADVRDEYIERTPPEYLKRISDTKTELSKATFLWSEVETVMGYNDHQFEVPKQCLRFFSGDEGPVKEDDQVYVTFKYDGVPYSDRSIRAHPNQMCRVNLPNEIGKRYTLPNYSVVFERLRDRVFKIDLVPDDEADQTLEPLRERSQSYGQVLTMARADREYGWL